MEWVYECECVSVCVDPCALYIHVHTFVCVKD